MKSHQSILSLFLLLAVFSQAQGVWTSMPNSVGTYGRYGSAGFSIGNSGYVCSGNVNSSLANDLWQYDPSNDSWTQQANYPGTASIGPVAFVINGKGYVGGGQYGSNYSSSFCEYDPTTNQWTQKNNTVVVQRYHCSSFSIGIKGYVALGQSVNGLQPDIWEYDPTNDTWTQRANFPGLVRYGPFGFSINGKGYCGAGSQSKFSSTFYQDVWEFDPLSNSWTQKNNFPGSGRSEAGSFVIGNFGYILNGRNPNMSWDSWKYDPQSDSWIQIASIGYYSESSYFSLLGKGYLIGGVWISTSSVVGNWVLQYDPNAVGIKEQTLPQSVLNIFPNPASSSLKLSVSGVKLNEAEIEIFDVNGSSIQKRKINDLNSTIEVSNLASGIYFLKFHCPSGEITKRFIKD